MVSQIPAVLAAPRPPRSAAILPLVKTPPGFTREWLSAAVGPLEPFRHSPTWSTLEVLAPPSDTGFGTRENPMVVRGTIESLARGGMTQTVDATLWVTPDEQSITGYATGMEKAPLMVLGVLAGATVLGLINWLGFHSPYLLLAMVIPSPMWLWLVWLAGRSGRMARRSLPQFAIQSLFYAVAGTDPATLVFWPDAAAYEPSRGLSLLQSHREGRWRRRPWLWVLLRTGLGLFFVFLLAQPYTSPEYAPLSGGEWAFGIGVLVLTLLIPLIRAIQRVAKTAAPTGS